MSHPNQITNHGKVGEQSPHLRHDPGPAVPTTFAELHALQLGYEAAGLASDDTEPLPPGLHEAWYHSADEPAHSPAHVGRSASPSAIPPMPPAAKKPTPNVYAAKADTSIGMMKVVRPDGSTHSKWKVMATMQDWFNLLMLHYPLAMDETDATSVTVVVPLAAMAWDAATTVAFNACTLDACSDYMMARWGRRLHSTDREWLSRHPWATDDGVPMAATPMALHQLLEPYGFGVHRVRVRTGTTVAGEQLSDWMHALGINPFALADATTTNAQAAAQMGLPLDAADAMFRFEFHDEPLLGSVIGERGWSSGGSVAVGAGGGHARYLAPRGTAGDWAISIQFAPRSELQYLIPPTEPAYVPREGAKTPRLAQIQRPDGAPVAVLFNGKYYDPDALPVVSPATPSSVVTPPGASGLVDVHGNPLRLPTGTVVTPLSAYGTPLDGPAIGMAKWVDHWEGRQLCIECEDDATMHGFVLRDCPLCKVINPTPLPALPALTGLIRPATEPARSPVTRRGFLAAQFHPYSEPNCAVCHTALTAPDDFPFGVDEETADRYAHTDLCVNCVADALHNERCDHCDQLLVSDMLVADAEDADAVADWAVILPTITNIEWAPMGPETSTSSIIVTYACAACGHEYPTDDHTANTPFMTLAAAHRDSFATPEQFRLSQSGRDLEVEYLQLLLDESEVEDDEEDDDDLEAAQIAAMAANDADLLARLNAAHGAPPLPVAGRIDEDEELLLQREYGNESVGH